MNDMEDTAFGPVRPPAFLAAAWSEAVAAHVRRGDVFERLYGPSRHGHSLPPTDEQWANWALWKSQYERLQQTGYEQGWIKSGYEPDEIVEPLGEFVYDETEEEFAKREAAWRARVAPDGVVHIPIWREES